MTLTILMIGQMLCLLGQLVLQDQILVCIALLSQLKDSTSFVKGEKSRREIKWQCFITIKFAKYLMNSIV